MTKTQILIKDISDSRRTYLDLLSRYSEEQAHWKPDPESWNMVEITEHLYWAEFGGIMGMWKTLDAIRSGKTERLLEFDHKGMSIEEVVEKTWQEKEKVPAVAAPRMGGTIGFWSASLQSLQEILESFGQYINDDELHIKAHPHPISGSLDFHQRLEFLRFHIDRHKNQAERLGAALKNA